MKKKKWWKEKRQWNKKGINRIEKKERKKQTKIENSTRKQ